MEKEIGGYFGLELSSGIEYHDKALHLNSGRAALQYLIRAKKIKKLYLPAYVCDSVLTPIREENIAYEYYSISEDFKPEFNESIGKDEAFLYVNYFGINDANVKSVVDTYENVIIDNTQAFYSQPLPGIDTFYSARKFFGVPDGAYLYTDTKLPSPLPEDISCNRMSHLLTRLDISANAGYNLFRENSEDINRSGLRSMSKLTTAIMKSIDYERVAEKRRENYLYLHEVLGNSNLLKLPELGTQIPMIYPYLTTDAALRSKLIEKKIYVATYWNEVLSHAAVGSVEERYTNYLLALPIDQRYNKEDMNYIYSNISNSM